MARTASRRRAIAPRSCRAEPSEITHHGALAKAWAPFVLEEEGCLSNDVLDSEGNLDAPSMMDAMRGSILIVALKWLRAQRLEEAYLAALPAHAKQTLLAADVTTWIPMDVTLIHYAVLDSLGLSLEQRIEYGASVSRSVNGVILSTVARLAGSVGLSPFTPLGRSAKLFARGYRGGAVAAIKTGPSEARFEVLGCPIAHSACFRDNIAGALLDGSRPFAAHVVVSEITARRTSTSYAFRIRW